MATFNYSDIEVELPKKTLKVAKQIDDVYKANTISQERSYTAQYKFVCDIIGKENADEILDGTSIDTIDVVELTKVFKGIEHAYIVSVAEYENELLAPQLDKINELAKSALILDKTTKR